MDNSAVLISTPFAQSNAERGGAKRTPTAGSDDKNF
jgi:hypothetical protein